MQSLDRDLGPGSKGEDVRALQAYLTRYGYFPNPELAAQYPRWRPIVATAPTPGVYDEATAEAVMALQSNSNCSSRTGIVDRTTRERLRAPRCGVPDGIPALDPRDKFALQGSKWPKNTLITWTLQTPISNNVLTVAEARNALAIAFATWEDRVELRFQETTGTPTLKVVFTPELAAAATAFFPDSPPQDRVIKVNSDLQWSTQTPTPFNRLDFITVMVHEIGHALGLCHSAVGASAMTASHGFGVQRRALTFDDLAAMIPFYSRWVATPGCGQDIAAGFASLGSGPVWRIGCQSRTGGFNIEKFNPFNDSWIVDSAPGSAAVAIALDSNNRPWVVNSFGQIFQKTSTEATSGGWTFFDGCARDIGAGAEGSVWVIGCGPGPNFPIFKRVGNGWHQEVSGGGATKIAVDMLGRPWVVNSFGHSFFRTSADPLASASWTHVPAPNAADIGITFATGTPTAYPIITGAASDPRIFVYNLQPATGDSSCGGSGSPSRNQWIPMDDGGASRISVGSGGPWVINGAGGTFRLAK